MNEQSYSLAIPNQPNPMEKNYLALKAGILNHSSPNSTSIPNAEREAIRRPQQPTKYEGLIINTLLKAKNEGKAKNTVISINHSLTQISRHADLRNPKK